MYLSYVCIHISIYVCTHLVLTHAVQQCARARGLSFPGTPCCSCHPSSIGERRIALFIYFSFPLSPRLAARNMALLCSALLCCTALRPVARCLDAAGSHMHIHTPHSYVHGRTRYIRSDGSCAAAHVLQRTWLAAHDCDLAAGGGDGARPRSGCGEESREWSWRALWWWWPWWGWWGVVVMLDVAMVLVWL